MAVHPNCEEGPTCCSSARPYVGFTHGQVLICVDRGRRPSLLLQLAGPVARIAIPLAIVVTLLVEMLTSLPGIGALMIRSQRNYQSSEVYALLVFVGLFGFVVNDLFAVVEGVIMRRWPPRE